MAGQLDLRESLIGTWRTNNRITVLLFENLPAEVWPLKVPGAPRRTVRMIAGHLHNARCMWIKMTVKKHGVAVPESVDRHKVAPPQLLAALRRSSDGIVSALELGLDRGGKLPGFPRDVVHFLAYLIAHEGHHRGQIIMLARQLGHRLPQEVTTTGMWDWSKRAKEALS